MPVEQPRQQATPTGAEASQKRWGGRLGQFARSYFRVRGGDRSNTPYPDSPPTDPNYYFVFADDPRATRVYDIRSGSQANRDAKGAFHEAHIDHKKTPSFLVDKLKKGVMYTSVISTGVALVTVLGVMAARGEAENNQAAGSPIPDDKNTSGTRAFTENPATRNEQPCDLRMGEAICLLPNGERIIINPSTPPFNEDPPGGEVVSVLAISEKPGLKGSDQQPLVPGGVLDVRLIDQRTGLPTTHNIATRLEGPPGDQSFRISTFQTPIPSGH